MAALRDPFHLLAAQPLPGYLLGPVIADRKQLRQRAQRTLPAIVGRQQLASKIVRIGLRHISYREVQSNYSVHLKEKCSNAEKMDASFRNSEFLQHPNPDLTDQKREIGRLENIQERGDLTDAIAREVIDFNDWLRKEAAVSLGTLARETKSAHKEDEESA